MYAQLEKSKENKNRTTGNSIAQKRSNSNPKFSMKDNLYHTVIQGYFTHEGAKIAMNLSNVFPLVKNVGWKTTMLDTVKTYQSNID
jgi:hypothetical protein